MRFFHLEAAPAPKDPGAEVGAEQVRWERLGRERC